MAFLKSARSVETVTEIGYHRCDRGLYLQVAGSGTKSWLFRYKSPVTGKQREMGLGSLNLVSLASARDIAVECRRQVLSGLDPLEERPVTDGLPYSWYDTPNIHFFTYRDFKMLCDAQKIRILHCDCIAETYPDIYLKKMFPNLFTQTAVFHLSL